MVSALPRIESGDLITKLMVWPDYNLAALALMCAPFLSTFIWGIFNGNEMNRQPLYTVGLVAVGTLLFWGLGTLYSIPQELAHGVVTERYYAYLVPLMGVTTLSTLGGMGLDKARRVVFAVVGSVVAALLLVGASQLLLHSPPYYFMLHEAIYSFTSVQPEKLNGIW